MTITEAEEMWEGHILWVMNKLQLLGRDEPDAAYMRFKHETFIYAQLTADFVPASEYSHWATAKGRLDWWGEKYKYYRSLGQGELNKYLIQRIQEARNGV